MFNIIALECIEKEAASSEAYQSCSIRKKGLNTVTEGVQAQQGNTWKKKTKTKCNHHREEILAC